MQERLHKLLAHAGFGSRRSCELLIEEGRVTVNGQVAKVGDKGDPGVDDIRINGRRIKAERLVYFLLNKPPGFLCTNHDPAGRKIVGDLLEGVAERVYPVGRLDGDSRGLVIMTNDGDLAARLTHPRYEVPKTYEVEVDGRLPAEDAEKLISGVWLSEGKTGKARIRVLHRGNARSRLEITLREGRNRQVRRMLVRLGHKVRRLTRTRIGGLTLHGLGVGRFRPLTAAEVTDLYRDTRITEISDGGLKGKSVAGAKGPSRHGPPASKGAPDRKKGVRRKAKAAGGTVQKGKQGGAKRAVADDRKAMARRRIRDFTA